ncbi:uncharacterized protein LOC135704148 [Ochlerotatus camptorhynchus]|uniref:uncharacterized protein LOC135704148 n=1 Tax=Ochlerotatus camptorhynchus TaxID=644619 RepID=UPI0031D96DE3
MEACRKMKLEKGYEEMPNEASATEDDESAMELGPEDDADPESYIEEEMLIFADFENYLTPEELADPNVRVKVIGIESESPVIQINNDVYRGSYDFALGTNVFLEEDDEKKNTNDPLYNPNPPKFYKYSGQGNKVLRMKRIFTTPKTDVATVKTEPADTTEESRTTQTERYLVTRSYEEALNLHLPVGCNPPRFIDSEHNCENIVHRKTLTLTTVESDVEDDAKRDDPRDVDYKPGMDA